MCILLSEYYRCSPPLLSIFSSALICTPSSRYSLALRPLFHQFLLRLSRSLIISFPYLLPVHKIRLIPLTHVTGHRMIIIATNVAETSITIPGIRYVTLYATFPPQFESFICIQVPQFCLTERDLICLGSAAIKLSAVICCN